MLNKLINIITPSRKDRKPSYSQCGEDLIIDFVFELLKIKNPSYLEIGSHHPTFLSNTYSFYKKGCRGVLVEADPFLFKKIKSVRKKDKCLNVGVAANSSGKANFYVMSTRTLNTFSKEEAERYVSYGNQRIEQILEIPLVSIHEILRDNFQSPPNFLSLDVEGLDLEILQSYDFEHYAPEVVCVETLTYTEDSSERKMPEIMELMKEKGYFLYADTYINSIFVYRKAWKSRETNK